MSDIICQFKRNKIFSITTDEFCFLVLYYVRIGDVAVQISKKNDKVYCITQAMQ